MEQYVVYKISNRINGKSYIGRTKDLERRIKEHINKAHCTALHRAIKKYGIENFAISVLFEGQNFNEMIQAERELILSHGTMTPNGYNLILETSQGREPSEITKERMSTSQQSRVMKKGESGFAGVRQKKSKKCFETRVNFKKQEYSKHFKTKEEAAEAYDKVNLHLRGVGCGLNFPDKLQEYLKEDLEEYFKWFCFKPEYTSKQQGVSWHKLLKKWRVYYYVNCKQVIVGNFEKEEDAIKEAKKYYK
jgi:group I intron endonuclease